MALLKWLRAAMVSCVSGLLLLAATATVVHAQNHKTFRFESEHPNKVDVVIYSADRPGFQWPAPGRVYVLDSDEVTKFKVACLGGERVCYGAWVSGSESSYWGVGRGNKNRCSKCCYKCDGLETPVITLEE